MLFTPGTITYSFLECKMADGNGNEIAPTAVLPVGLHYFNYTVKNMRKSAVRLERQGDYWSEEDKENLSKMFLEGVGITEMAVILQRSETAIIQQIEKMNLYGRRLYPARQKNCSEQPKCLCDNCMADPALCPLRRGGRCCQEGE